MPVRSEEDVRDELEEVVRHRRALVSRSFRLKMFASKPLAKFLEPLLQFAAYMGQMDMAEWILQDADAKPGFVDMR